MEHDYNDQSTDEDESTTTPHSRRDMLKLAGTVGAATLGATTLVETAAASETSPDHAATETTDSVASPAEQRSEGAEALTSVYSSCVWYSGTPGTPGATIKARCAEHAYANSWAYAGYILDEYSRLDNCRTLVGVSAEIEAHQFANPGGSITIGCSWK